MNKRWTGALEIICKKNAIWFVAFLIVWVVWEMSGRDFRWWMMVIFAGVIAVASFLSFRISPSTLSSGTVVREPHQPPSPSDA